MSAQFAFWLVVGVAVLLLLLFALREAVIFQRLPRGHRERGQYVFNGLMLCVAAATLSWGALYVDGGRHALEEVLVPYPGSRYAFEKNSIVRSTSWVYESKADKALIVEFYRNYTRAQNHEMLIDLDSDRLSFLLPSGKLFLTLKEVDGVTLLYFTREGEVLVITR